MMWGRRGCNEDPEVQHKRQDGEENQCKIVVDYDSGYSSQQSLNREVSVLELACHFVKMATWVPVRTIDLIVSQIFRCQFLIYRRIAGRSPNFLESYCTEAVEQLNERETQTRNNIGRLTDELKHKREEICLLENENASLRDSERKLESEKQDALTRLSELVSVKLRDNNPNIVDLNDQCRPTKLAEKFSELYDNEWTSAFTILEETFKEQHAIVNLLDIVMEVYGFCEEQVAHPWNDLTDWFLDMSFPGAQQTVKWLKDSRKAKIRNKVSSVGKKYEQKLLERCKENKLAEFLSEEEMQQYITKCVELCLLMVTTDPPVVLSCPGWTPGVLDQTTANIQGKSDEVTQHEIAHNEDIEEKDKSEVCQSTKERKMFDKELFKEYTKRGTYLDYVVWPALFLHKEGPLLSKGIAQGTKE